MSFDPNAAASPPPPQPRSGVSVALIVGIVVAVMIMLCLCAGVLTALLLPAVQAAREAARRNMCMNNMKMIGLGLQSYHDVYKTFPPAVTTDGSGQPLYSWRVLILPYLGDPQTDALYEKFDPTKAWDSPENAAVAASTPAIFNCPSQPPSSGMTSYVAVVGPETMWPGSMPLGIREITDGMSKTIAVVEASGSNINWLEPRDLTFDEAATGVHQLGGPPGIQSYHPGGANVLFADGSVHFLPRDTPPDTLRALLTARGDEEVAVPEY